MSSHSSYFPEFELEIQNWIEHVLEIKLKRKQPCIEQLKNGNILCDLLNKIQPGICNPPEKSNDISTYTRNVTSYLSGCKELGIDKNRRFKESALVKDYKLKSNQRLIINNLHSVIKLAKKKKIDAENVKISFDFANSNASNKQYNDSKDEHESENDTNAIHDEKVDKNVVTKEKNNKLAADGAAFFKQLMQIKTKDDHDVKTDEDCKVSKSSSDWNDILMAMKNSNINMREKRKNIQKLIEDAITSKRIGINDQCKQDGNKTLLMYAVIMCDLELVEKICNFGADVSIQDSQEMDSLQWAVHFGYYKIIELLYFQTLSDRIGSDLKNISRAIHDKDQEAAILHNMNRKLLKKIYEYMITAIQKRIGFSSDLFYYAWYFARNDAEIIAQTNNDACKSLLWKEMMKQYSVIIKGINGNDNYYKDKDKKSWLWLKKYFMNSLIWYLQDKTDNSSDEQKTLFSRLLQVVEEQLNIVSEEMLSEGIETMKFQDEWDELVEYKEIKTDENKAARHDDYKCIPPKFDETQMYPSTTHFNARKHYDSNIYLNQLILLANRLDSVFQNDVKNLTQDICKINNIKDCTFRAGPVKMRHRAKMKAENGYSDKPWPISAQVIDLNRCTIYFDTIQSMFSFMQYFIENVKKGTARSISKIVRFKNGWSKYSDEQWKTKTKYSYADIKFNVLVQHPKKGSIIAEIQVLLNFMVQFKLRANHKLYSVQREKDKATHYVKKIISELSKYDQCKKNNDIRNVFQHLAREDDEKHFRLLWDAIIGNKDDQSFAKLYKTQNTKVIEDFDNTALFQIFFTNNNIHSYLLDTKRDSYSKAMIQYISEYGRKYGFHEMLMKLYDLYHNDLEKFIVSLGKLLSSKKKKNILLRKKDKGD
eukprot:298190_1